MSITIIGAGIGGLTTAIALEQKEISAEIYEQAEELKPVGAGIIIANNAMQIYEKLGLRPSLEAAGNSISAMNITTPNLKPLSSIDLRYFEKKYKVKNIAIHRGKLQELLLDKLSSTKINLAHKLTSISPLAEGYQLQFQNQEPKDTSLVLGADGLYSQVRKDLFPDSSIRTTGQICWRAVTRYRLAQQYRHELNEAWGKAERFGFVQISDDLVYWYAVKSYRKDENELSVKHLRQYFQNYHPLITELIDSTTEEHTYTAEISELNHIDHWFRDGVCLVGDAAHAMTPNMGQGACQAIEDAYVLAECLTRYPVKQAFAEYQRLRLPKAHHVAQRSRQIGQMAHLSNPLLVTLRNQVMRMTPPSVSRRQSEKIFELSEV